MHKHIDSYIALTRCSNVSSSTAEERGLKERTGIEMGLTNCDLICGVSLSAFAARRGDQVTGVLLKRFTLGTDRPTSRTLAWHSRIRDRVGRRCEEYVPHVVKA